MLLIRYLLAVSTAGFSLMLLAVANEFATDAANGIRFPTAFAIVAVPVMGSLASLIALPLAIPFTAIAYFVARRRHVERYRYWIISGLIISVTLYSLVAVITETAMNWYSMLLYSLAGGIGGFVFNWVEARTLIGMGKVR